VQRLLDERFGDRTHFAIELLSILVDHTDRRAREDIMELIQEHLFPAIVKCLLRVLVFVPLEDRRKRGDVLGVAHQNLGLTIALLDRAMRCIRPAMELQIQFTVPIW